MQNWNQFELNGKAYCKTENTLILSQFLIMLNDFPKDTSISSGI